MGVRESDAVPIGEAQASLTALAEDAVPQGAEKLLTKNGASDVALADARRREHCRALEAEHAGLVLVQGALEGLEDLAAGRILSEEELDQALALPPARKPPKTR
jgi:hypothetical protein